MFPRVSNPTENKEEAMMSFTAYSQKWHSITLPYPIGHTDLVQCVCIAGGTVQGHEYQEGRSIEGQPGGWLPQITFVTTPKDIKHLWINLTKYMLNLHTENDKIITEKNLKDLNKGRYIQCLWIVRHNIKILIFPNVLGFNVISITMPQVFLNRN